jgi:hypothetical protein
MELIDYLILFLLSLILLISVTTVIDRIKERRVKKKQTKLSKPLFDSIQKESDYYKETI